MAPQTRGTYRHSDGPSRLRSIWENESIEPRVKAIILAAGRGRRLRPHTSDQPKCLLRIGNSTILEHLFSNLEIAGIRDATLVCGYRLDRVQDAINSYGGNVAVHLTYNPFFSVADNLISLWAARAQMDRDFLIINGDNVFSPAVLPLLAHAGTPCCVMVRRQHAYDADDMKVAIRGGRIVAIGKDLNPVQTSAESIGIMKFSGTGVRWLRGILEECVMVQDAMRSLFPSAIQNIIDHGHHVSYCDIGQLPCADIDTPEDLCEVRYKIKQFTRTDIAVATPAGGHV